MADAVDTALVAKLAGDATLTGLMPDGVFWDVAPSGSTRFVIVSLLYHEDTDMFGGTAYQMGTYLVKAVELSGSAANTKSAAARIDALLNNQTLTVAGMTHMLTRRAERVRYVEVDAEQKDARWQHRGGRYDVWVSP